MTFTVTIKNRRTGRIVDTYINQTREQVIRHRKIAASRYGNPQPRTTITVTPERN